LSDEGIGLQSVGNYEVLSSNQLFILDRLAELNNALLPIFKEEIYQPVPKLISEFGFATHFVKGIIKNVKEGIIDTGKMMRNLIRYVTERGVLYLTGASVNQLESNQTYAVVHVKTGSEEIQFRAKQVAICTNAFTKQFFSELDLQPGRGQVLVTQPVERVPFVGGFHFEEGFYYFRNLGNRILLGGGRNLDFKAEETTEFGVTELIQKRLEDYLETWIYPQKKLTIEHRWAGIMAFGSERKPILEEIQPNLWLAVRCGGMGVALGSLLAEELAKKMLNKNT
ncbi:MAG: FAD-binding oxidoreductase, partial [Bacteroidia bacterium]|nr:FAD-binding oxidoreductase [Bacteroidia bacterium]